MNNINKAIIIAGILSVAFLLPLFKEPAEVQVFPEETVKSVINIQQPLLHISSSSPVIVNISNIFIELYTSWLITFEILQSYSY